MAQLPQKEELAEWFLDGTRFAGSDLDHQGKPLDLAKEGSETSVSVPPLPLGLPVARCQSSDCPVPHPLRPGTPSPNSFRLRNFGLKFSWAPVGNSRSLQQSSPQKNSR